MSTWYVYILQCADESLYTGVTTNIERRLRQHNGELSGGAKYTRIRRPLQILYSAEFQNRSEASKEEYRIKNMTRQQKKELIG